MLAKKPDTARRERTSPACRYLAHGRGFLGTRQTGPDRVRWRQREVGVQRQFSLWGRTRNI